jgi:hypothetical protein
MQNARVTFLTTPARKAELEKRASRLGLSSAEYIRLAVDNYDRSSEAQEAELASLVEQVNEAVPKIQASLDRSCERLETLHAEMDAFFREKGVR